MSSVRLLADTAIRHAHTATAGTSRSKATPRTKTPVRWINTGKRVLSGEVRKRQVEMERQRDLIMSVLEAQPSARDSRFYLRNFDPASRPSTLESSTQSQLAGGAQKSLRREKRSDVDGPAFPLSDQETPTTAYSRAIPTAADLDSDPSAGGAVPPPDLKGKTAFASELLSAPASRHTALVKVQGPFSDRQLESIAEGMVYLKKLGLVSIIVMDHEHWTREEERIRRLNLPEEDGRELIVRLREEMKRETIRFSDMLEAKGGTARPLLEGVLCVHGAAFEDTLDPIASTSARPYEKTTEDLFVDSLSGIRNAVRRGEIPVIPPIAIDASCFSLCVSANDAVRAIAHGLADAESWTGLRYEADARLANDVDLTPSEFDYINKTFIWHDTHPTALSNLALVRDCLSHLPRTASAVLVSHRSPRSLIANLITNKPAHSPSLSHDLLPRRNMQHQPTIVRRGLPIRVHRNMDGIDEDKMTYLLEESFGKTLDRQPFYDRLRNDLDFCIVAGDYQACAIVTNEVRRDPMTGAPALDPETGLAEEPISYLDKFAVLPSLQGDGTVDFLWGALRDESWGLGLLDALNPNVGGLGGQGIPRDLVWRSRSNNPVNKWYHDRSTGFFKIPPPPGGAVGFALFWCEVEDRASEFMRDEKEGKKMRSAPEKLTKWAPCIGAIPSCWV
ncbi:Amino-acid acetyltransferase, mitochondrial [Rhodotorula mucilaginosa]|uniref:Amino-acid acetyltransferase, mitochondrial n=1 Tax=Rhodotorula mucilaginosa TaxID=5537 RepID=A0A9P6VRU6_RHOMI|nr:Amino-acid acetyltransferase, mitochondrial [Rhodotorula mucilaginosa]